MLDGDAVVLLAKIGSDHFLILDDVIRLTSAIFLPDTSTASRCEKFMTARMICSIMMMVTPRSLRRISSVTISSRPRNATGRPSIRRDQ